MSKESKCTKCQRASSFDKCSIVECPKRKPISARMSDEHVYAKDGIGASYKVPSQRTDRDWD